MENKSALWTCNFCGKSHVWNKKIKYCNCMEKSTNIIPRCNTCVHFKKTYAPKLSWVERKEEAKEIYPKLSEPACAALANDRNLWEQTESGKGFCTYHAISDEIPHYFSCLNHKIK